MKFTILRALNQGKIVIYGLFILYSMLNAIGIFMQFKLGLSNPLIVKSTLLDIMISKFILNICLAISLLILYQYTNEVKNNNLTLMLLAGKKWGFLIKDLLGHWIINLLILTGISFVFIYLVHFFLNETFELPYPLFRVVLAFIYSTFFFVMLAFMLSFIVKKYFSAFLILVALNIAESIADLYFYATQGINIAAYLPLKSSISLFLTSETWGIFPVLFYLSITCLFTFLALRRYFKSPLVLGNDAGI